MLGQKLQGALSAETAQIDNALRVTQARYAAEQQIVDAKLQQAKATLDAATTDEARASAAREIYEQTVRQAELQYNATVAAAEAEEQKLAAQARYIQGQAKIQQMKLAEAKAAGTVTKAHYEAVNQANQALQIAQQNIQAQQQITDAIIRGADATLQKQMEAARVTMEMQMQTQQQAQTNSAIAEGANQMSRLANEAERARAASSGISAAAAVRSGGVNTADHSHKQYDKFKLDSNGNIVETSDDERRRQMNQASISKANAYNRQIQAWDAAYAGSDYNARVGPVMQRGGMLGVAGSQMANAFNTGAGVSQTIKDFLYEMGQAGRPTEARFAEGGYVTGATQAVVGEGGEPEYIIPASKMNSAMQRYSSGMRGSSVIPGSANVSVNYSGSTVDMGGTSYINKGDVNGIVSQAVNQTLSTLAKSPRARLGAGLR